LGTASITRIKPNNTEPPIEATLSKEIDVLAPCDPAIVDEAEAGRKLMEEYRETFRTLAK